MVSVLGMDFVVNLLFLIDFIALVGKQESFSVSFYLSFPSNRANTVYDSRAC